MLGKNEISKQEAIFLTYISAAGNLMYPSWIAIYAGRATWIALGLGILLMIPLALWILYIGKKYSGLTIFEIITATLGKYVSGFLTFVYILIAATVAFSTLNLFSHTVKTFSLPFTPVWAIMTLLVLVAVAITGSGIRKMARLAAIHIVLFIINYFGSYSITLYKSFKIEYIFPIFNTSLSGFGKGTLIAAGIAAQCLLFMMALVGAIPKNHEEYYASIAKGLSLWAITMMVGAGIVIGTSSAEIYQRMAYVGVNAARFIRLGEFVRGIEILVQFTYQGIAMLTTSWHLYGIWIATSSFLKGNRPKFLLMLAALLVLIPSIWINSYNNIYFPLMQWLSYITLGFSILVLLVATVGALLRGRK